MIDYLKQYKKSNTVRFHMPGHKGRISFEDIKNLSEIDITEIEGSDNLHQPEGIIKESQNKAAKLFGTKETIFLVNGSTSGIYSAITGILAPKETLLIQRDSHKSVYNSVVLGDIKTEYIYSEYNYNEKLNIGISLIELEEKLKKRPDIKAVFLTYPTYYGICMDIKRICEIVHRYNKILIIDEAHGSHLKFNSNLPESSIDLGADIVIQSTHKTLTGLTQTAMIHICSDSIDSEKVKEMAAIYQTTSPSYILMASIDWTVNYMKEEGVFKLKALLKNIEELESAIEKLKTIRKVSRYDVEKLGLKMDETKILLQSEGKSGKELEDYLRSEGIEIEMSDRHYSLLMTSLENNREDFLRLIKALKKLDTLETSKEKVDYQQDLDCPEKILELRESFYLPKEYVDLTDSVGRVSGDFLIPYPPGIPVLVPGEKITKNIIEQILNMAQKNMKILGIYNNKVKVLKGY